MSQENKQTSNRRYIKGTTPFTAREAITTYIEFTDEQATRQVDIVGNRWFSSAYTNYHDEIGPALTREPLSKLLPLEPEACEITQQEFEEVWNEALVRSPS